ncbi:MULTISPECIES: hypothetical protein [unclassified Rhizobium]
MPETPAHADVIMRVCEQLDPDDKTVAVGEVMAAAALVAITAGLSDDQAIDALESGLSAIRAAEPARAN